MAETATLTFETQPYYQITDEGIYDRRVLAIASSLVSCEESSFVTSGRDRRSESRVHSYEHVDQRGSDGDDFSGFIALVDLDARDGRKLAVMQSWQGGNNTGIPVSRHSWSAEFDDREVARDFWKNHWRSLFDGSEFVKDAKEYLAANPDIPRRSIRIQELGMLSAWHSQRFGEHVFLDQFATIGNESLVPVPNRYEEDAEFEVGRVYAKPVKNEFGIVMDRIASTCLAAFTVEGGRPYLSTAGWTTPLDYTYIQWSTGQLEAYAHPTGPENGGPAALKKADLGEALSTDA